MNTSKRIMSVIGPDAMQQLVNEFGGERILVPLEVPNVTRNGLIFESFSESLKSGASCMSSYEYCADEFGLTTRRIQQIVHEQIEVVR